VRTLFRVTLFTALAHLGGAALADPPQVFVPSPPGVIPGPVIIQAPAAAYPPAFYRPNPYAVWQGYGVSRQGWFRPRVIYSPGYGPAFYAATGEPYPWLSTHPSWYVPYAGNSP
jgi:hypothetical protein